MSPRKQSLQLPKRMLWFYINNKEAHRNIFSFMMGHSSGSGDLTIHDIPTTPVPPEQNASKPHRT